MVDGGATGWLLKTLPLGCNAEGSLNSYSFEYATALFMNLCLCPRGRQACSAQAQLTIEVIVQLYDRNVPGKQRLLEKNITRVSSVSATAVFRLFALSEGGQVCAEGSPLPRCSRKNVIGGNDVNSLHSAES